MKIYVGNLPRTATEEELERLFSCAGKVVEVKIVVDVETGASREFGFVRMEEGCDVRQVIHDMQGATLGGNTLQINKARTGRDRRRNRQEASYKGPERRKRNRRLPVPHQIGRTRGEEKRYNNH